MDRRQFLRRSTVATASAVVGFPAILRSASPNSMLQVACIGVGRMGGNTMKAVASHPKVKITALCDVDTGFLDPAAKTHPDASRHRDWRELLSQHAGKFDALTIGTPDHMHAAPAVTALRAKKHLYLQKPMATTLHECRVITEEAKKAGVVTQLGNQGRSSVESRMTVQLLRSGAIGKVKEVILWENKPLGWWPKNTELRAQGDAIPAGLDWNLWLGVQEARPYLADTYHPQNWRAWFGFGGGELGDMGCHHFDTSFDALKLTAPLRVRQRRPAAAARSGAKRIVELVFPGSDMTAGRTVPWRRRDRAGSQQVQLPKGMDTLSVSRGLVSAARSSRTTAAANHNTGIPCRQVSTGPQTTRTTTTTGWTPSSSRKACDEFAHGGPLTSVLVGAMADRHAGEWLDWGPQGAEVHEQPKANALVHRAYRDGWKVAGLGDSVMKQFSPDWRCCSCCRWHCTERSAGKPSRAPTSPSSSRTTWASPTSAVTAARFGHNLDRWRAAACASRSSRCALCGLARGVTGLHPHQVGITGWTGLLNQRCVTACELLKRAGTPPPPWAGSTWSAEEVARPANIHKRVDRFLGSTGHTGRATTSGRAQRRSSDGQPFTLRRGQFKTTSSQLRDSSSPGGGKRPFFSLRALRAAGRCTRSLNCRKYRELYRKLGWDGRARSAPAIGREDCCRRTLSPRDCARPLGRRRTRTGRRSAWRRSRRRWIRSLGVGA